MLSKVLSGRDTARAQAPVFSSVLLRPAEFGRQRGADTTGPSDDDRRDLHDRILALEAELIAARHDCFEAGRRQGEQQARTELAPVLERMNSSVAELVGMRHEIRSHVEKDAVQLSLLIAKRILHREISVDPNALIALAKVVFERLTRAESYRVIVHPQFADAVRSALPATQLSRVSIEPDPGAAPGTLIIRSEEGLIDASVDAQLDEIRRGLTDRLAHS